MHNGIFGLPSRGAGRATFPALPPMMTWWDFTDPAVTTVVSSAYSGVTDKSGRGNNLVQATGGSRPAVSAAALNGRDVAFFSSKFMTCSSWSVPGRFTHFVVVKGTSGNGMVFEHSADLNTNDGHYIYTTNTAGTSVKRSNANGGSVGAMSSTWLQDSLWKIVAIRRAGAELSLWINNSMQYIDNTSCADVVATNTLYLGSRGGASLFFPGYQAEHRVWPVPLTDAQMTQAFNELNAKHSVY